MYEKGEEAPPRNVVEDIQDWLNLLLHPAHRHYISLDGGDTGFDVSPNNRLGGISKNGYLYVYAHEEHPNHEEIISIEGSYFCDETFCYILRLY